MRELRALVRYLATLTAERTREKLRVRALLREQRIANDSVVAAAVANR